MTETAKRYLISYNYVTKRDDGQSHRDKPYFIYPKRYKAILTKDQYQRLNGCKAFRCQTSIPGKGDFTETGWVYFIKPAKEEDLKKYKPLKLTRVMKDLSAKQKLAAYAFMRIKAKKYKERHAHKAKRAAQKPVKVAAKK